VGVAIALLLASCARADIDEAAESVAPVNTEPVTSPTTTPASSAAVVVDDGARESADPAEAFDVRSGALLPLAFADMLAQLGDYQIELQVRFEGVDTSGTPVTFEVLSRESVAHDPARSRLDLDVGGSGYQGELESMSLVRWEDTVYMHVPEIGCVSGDIAEFNDAMLLPLDPRTLLEGLTAAQAVAGGAVVNEIATTEFRFDESTMPWASSGQWSVNGSLFVDEGSDFATRAAMIIDGRGDLLDDGRQLDGEYEITIDITGIPADQLIAVPAPCRDSLPYPVTTDAFNVTSIDDLLSFKSYQSLDEVVAFYLGQMPLSGWELSSDPDLFDDLVIMSFIKDQDSRMITAEYDSVSGATSVLISP
jgi:hypothetical protein